MPADPSRPPNPAKSAWFLLWIQELVSYGTSFIYAAVALVVLLLALPWLPLRPPENASWFPRSQRVVSAFVLAAFALVLALTLVASFLRGPNWRLDFPF
jgi:multisubunit Na+/H+ antiporter MnhB subunit